MSDWIEEVLKQLAEVCKEIADEEKKSESNSVSRRFAYAQSGLRRSIVLTVSWGTNNYRRGRAEALCKLLVLDSVVSSEFKNEVIQRLTEMLEPLQNIDTSKSFQDVEHHALIPIRIILSCLTE